jgi:hypothetical protein
VCHCLPFALRLHDVHSFFAAMLPLLPESSAVDNFSSFVGPKKPLRNKGTAGGAAGTPRDSKASFEAVPCPSCQAPQSVRTSKTPANPDRQVPSV